jgi:ATP-dependent exoDNAse (exonuclease V) alpha subunit
MWSPQQEAALKAVDRWFFTESKNQQVFRIFGYAGTGKTTLATHFAQNIDGLVLFAAFTGKAALVMRKRGCEGARTIHSLIYIAEPDKKTGEVTWRLNRESMLKEAALLIIDECSMVDEELAKDLLSFGVPILVLGDPAQLPPVSGAGYFTDAKPDVMLTEIHRQAKDNPIVYLASQIREGIYPDYGDYGDSRIITKATSADALNADQIIVGRNATRDSMNFKMRKLLKIYDEYPIQNDKLICLRNDRDRAIFNGGMFRVDRVFNSKYKTNFLNMSLNPEDDDEGLPVMVKVHKSFFSADVAVPDWKMLKGSQEFDFGYAITCHKSQGSQWENVLIYDESWCFRDEWQRWLYTAITRASEKITLVKS